MSPSGSTDPTNGSGTAARLYDAYVFDMDGTIYLGDDLLPGAARLVEVLRERDLPVRFLSNNPTKNPQQYADKLDTLGLPTPVDDIVNTVVATTAWLTEHHPDAVVYPIAEQPLIDALRDAGIALSDDPARIDIVLASYDRSFVYDKLQVAFDAIWYHQRAFLMATNPDRFCPVAGGRGEPDCAAIIAAIEACTGTQCQTIVGKPDPAMLEASLRGLDVAASDCVMVGDRISTDIAMAKRAGADSALVLTGESRRGDVEDAADDERPDLVLERVDHVLPAAVRDELGWTDDG